MQTGLSLGAASGPLLFGVVAQTWSYAVAWTTTAMLGLAAGLTVRAGRRMVRTSRGLPVAGRRGRTPGGATIPPPTHLARDHPAPGPGAATTRETPHEHLPAVRPGPPSGP